jgi:hypothetical protein
MPGGSPSQQLALAAGIVGLGSFAIGLAASTWLPEPAGTRLPE